MKFAAIALVAAGIAAAGTATAATSTIRTDMDYLRASRCRGLAAGAGADTAGIDAILSAEGRGRPQLIQLRGEEEMNRGKRDARSVNKKDSVAAELSGACAAYLGATEANVAGR